MQASIHAFPKSVQACHQQPPHPSQSSASPQNPFISPRLTANHPRCADQALPIASRENRVSTQPSGRMPVSDSSEFPIQSPCTQTSTPNLRKETPGPRSLDLHRRRLHCPKNPSLCQNHTITVLEPPAACGPSLLLQTETFLPQICHFKHKSRISWISSAFFLAGTRCSKLQAVNSLTAESGARVPGFHSSSRFLPPPSGGRYASLALAPCGLSLCESLRLHRRASLKGACVVCN